MQIGNTYELSCWASETLLGFQRWAKTTNIDRNITFQLRFIFHLLLLLCIQSLVERPNWFLLTPQQYTYFSVDDIQFWFLYFYGPAFRLFLTQIRTKWQLRFIFHLLLLLCIQSRVEKPHSFLLTP